VTVDRCPSTPCTNPTVQEPAAPPRAGAQAQMEPLDPTIPTAPPTWPRLEVASAHAPSVLLPGVPPLKPGILLLLASVQAPA
jgi:hypothetical protein